MARARRFNDYSNVENVPSWVEPDEREEAMIKRWVEEDTPKKKKAASKKKSIPKKKPVKKAAINKHSGKQSQKKFYAIKKGRQNRVIVESWAECSKLVIGYKGAIYKGFKTRSEAELFME